MARILSTRQLTPVTKLFVVDAPLIARAARPGQFVILRVREGGERVPVTIADYDSSLGTITLVVQAVGVTTTRICELEAGEEILDVVGPLGSPVEIPAAGHVVVVGGGFGTAALLCLMRDLTQRGTRTTALLGARTKELLILVEELRRVATNVEICTDDGSAGYHGLVTGRLAELIAGQGPGRPDHVIAIGPVVMMRAVAEATRPLAIPTLASMDPLMIDGTGMCGGCRVIVGGQPRFACVDGPCFDAHQVDFAVAMRRSKTYVREEHLAAERLAAATGAR